MRCSAELLASVLALGVAGPAVAQTAGPAHIATSATIEAGVARAVAERWRVPVERVRLELDVGAAWPAGVGEFELMGGGNGEFVLAFTAAGREHRLRVRAGVDTDVSKAAHPIERGETLAAEDLVAAREVVWGAPRGNELLPAAGWTAKRRIAAGEILRRPAVEPPRAVRPGDSVQLVFERGGIRIVLTGRAAGSAAVGERVSVRAETGRLLEGVAIEPGIVRIGPAGEDR